MAISWHDRLSQGALVLTEACSLRCFFCPLWQGDGGNSGVLETMRSGRFSETYGQARLWNVMGGDPFSCAELPEILQYLKASGAKVRLWTHGMVGEWTWGHVLPYVDELMLYVASSESEEYLRITGWDGHAMIPDVIRDVKAAGVPIILHSPVRGDTVQYMPEFYEMAYAEGLPLWFSYERGVDLDQESRDFLKRFRDVDGVRVFEVKRLPGACAAVPAIDMRFVMQEVGQGMIATVHPGRLLRRLMG